MGLFKCRQKRAGPDGKARTYTSPNWSYNFKHPKTGRRIKASTGTRDRKAANTIYLDAMRRAADERAGHRTEYDDHAVRPIGEHLEDWRAALMAKGSAVRYVALRINQARSLINRAGANTWADINAHDTSTALNVLAQERDLGNRSYNAHLGSVKAFGRWMVANRRATETPFACISRRNERVDRRHVRRAFTPDELRHLLAAARNGPDRHLMTGRARATLYQLAAETGLRANEIRTLTWRGVDLDAEQPAITIEAGNSKRRRTDVVPLRASTAQILTLWRTQLREPDSEDRVFPHVHDKPGIMLREDFKAARDAWIGEEGLTASVRTEREKSDFLQAKTAEGVVDFHALRHTFITGLARAGVPVKVAMDLARHSDVNLTLRHYSHTIIGERAAALDVLPDLATMDDTEAVRDAG